MEEIEQEVARHYSHKDLERAILDALQAAGKDLDALTATDLAGVDEFHIGGLQATVALAEQMPVAPGQHLVDIGCGIGGVARYFAAERGCRVTGVDLSADFIATAEALTRRLKLDDRIDYRRASALALPFGPASVDGAYMLHVGMNIADKEALFAEARRVLKPGAAFALYEVMRDSEGALTYPLPWASSAETSFLETAATYRRLLEAAGFRVTHERNRRAFALEIFRQLAARPANQGRPASPGLQILMPDARQRGTNLAALVGRGILAPVEMIAVATEG